MHKFVIEGGVKLEGTVVASGSKNAALPILFAPILTSEPVRLQRVPALRDISTTYELLRSVGVEVEKKDKFVEVTAKKLTSIEANYELVRTMRASILILGPLLAREGRAKVSLPGGCAIGTRPIDIHLNAFEKMGVKFTLDSGYVLGECPDGLRGAEIEFRFPSVGATENILLAATLAKGITTIKNAAQEPEIVNLAQVLKAMGAKIQGEGTSKIVVTGVSSLHGADASVIFDRIEAGTLMLAGAMTGGRVRVEGVESSALGAYLDLLKGIGLPVEMSATHITVGSSDKMKPILFVTEPYPGMPTDLQAQLMALLAMVEGESVVSEAIFENRFMHVPELIRMGAKIEVNGGVAKVHGRKDCYRGATVMATDLRASASLVLAGLAAKGTTNVRRIYHLDRGYESLEAKLESLGARVKRLAE